MPSSKKSARSALQIGLLAVLFVLPPVAAYVLFYAGFRPAVGGNYGELIEPARPVADMALLTPDGRGFRFSELAGKWTLIYVGGRHCGEVCRQSLYKLNQVRLAQGKEMDRVASVYVRLLAENDVDVEKLEQTYPGVIFLLASPGSHSMLEGQLSGESVLQTEQSIYIVDPIGNVMMKYPAGADATGMRKDLKRLLKVSQVG